MEDILGRLSAPDSETIRQASLDLKQRMKDSDSIPQLCKIMISSSDGNIRQYSAFLLRKNFSKATKWFNQTASDRETLKDGFLSALIDENDTSVVSAIIHLISVVANHEWKTGGGAVNSWPKLIQFVSTQLLLTNTHSPPYLLKSLLLFSSMSEYECIGPNLKTFLHDFKPMFVQLLVDASNPELGYYVVCCLKKLVPYLGSDEVDIFRSIIGNVALFISTNSHKDKMADKVVESMDVFDELVESEVPILSPFLENIINMYVELLQPKLGGDVDEAIKVKALTFISNVIHIKKRIFYKKDLYVRVINTVFIHLCHQNEDDDDEESDLTTCAAQTLDVIAISLPPKKYMPVLLSLIQPSLDAAKNVDTNTTQLCRSYSALAVSTEGCTEYIRNNYLVKFLQNIDNGIRHPNRHVRKNALYALGQFSEFLQPEVSSFANDIFPVLISYIDTILANVQTGNNLTELDRIFFCLDQFCVNLESKIETYLPQLMERVLKLVDSHGLSNRLHELTISTMGSIACAAKFSFVPYLNRAIEKLKFYLKPQCETEGETKLLTQSLDTLGTLARATGPEHFPTDLALECFRFGINLLENPDIDDPDIRKSVFALFSSIAFLVKSEFSAVLPQAIPPMLLSLASKEGLTVEFNEDFDEESEEDDDDVNAEVSLDDDTASMDGKCIKAFNVENAYMEEKTQILLALTSICQDLGPQLFWTYIPQCLDEIWDLIEFFDDDVKQSAIQAFTKFLISIFKYKSSESQFLFSKWILLFFPKLCDTIQKDEETQTVCVCLECLADLFTQIGGYLTSIPTSIPTVVNLIRIIFSGQLHCMNGNEDEGDQRSDSSETERDQLLFEYASDLIPCIGKVVEPIQFGHIFVTFYPYLLKRYAPQKEPMERSSAIGVVADSLAQLKGTSQLQELAPSILNSFVQLLSDSQSNSDLVNNVVFGIGELMLAAYYTSADVNKAFPSILSELSRVMTETNSGRVRDQVVGAVCRLIIVDISRIPLESVLPVVFEHLPLKEDHTEYASVFKALSIVATNFGSSVHPHVPFILRLAFDSVVRSYDNEKDLDKVKSMACDLLRQLSFVFKNDFAQVLNASLSAAEINVLNELSLSQ